MHHQLNVLYNPCALLCLGASGIKCIIYAFLLFVAVCIQDEWWGRWNTLLWLPGLKGSGIKKSIRAGPVLPYTHKDALTQNTHMYKSEIARSPPPDIPCHLLAYLKVTCRSRWMWGLQPLKCPHEAKELFVSLEELQSLGCDWNRRLTLLGCFHHNRTNLCHRWKGTLLLFENVRYMKETER